MGRGLRWTSPSCRTRSIYPHTSRAAKQTPGVRCTRRVSSLHQNTHTHHQPIDMCRTCVPLYTLHSTFFYLINKIDVRNTESKSENCRVDRLKTKKKIVFIVFVAFLYFFPSLLLIKNISCIKYCFYSCLGVCTEFTFNLLSFHKK